MSGVANVLRWLIRLISLALLILGVCAIFTKMPADMPRIDVVTLILAATGVMLATLTIFLAILAFIGYIEIRKSSHRIALRAAIEAAEKVAAQTAERTASRAVDEYLNQRLGKVEEDYGAMAAGDDDAGKS